MDELERLRAFVKDVMLRASEGYDLDRDDLQQMGKEHGLLREEPYDPDKHGESEFEIEPGDPWYVLTFE